MDGGLGLRPWDWERGSFDLVDLEAPGAGAEGSWPSAALLLLEDLLLLSEYK